MSTTNKTPRRASPARLLLCWFCAVLAGSFAQYGAAREHEDAPRDPGIEREVSFVSGDVTLSGTLVLPVDIPTPRAVVVFVHGSGPQQRSIPLARQFASAGIGAFVYDKRGVGSSGGRYESAQAVSGSNIDRLAGDAAAALAALRELSELEGVNLGLAGISQAGWIAPLAAEKSDLAEFLLLWSGPVCKVSEEDIYSKYTKDRDGGAVPAYAEALAARKTPYRWPDFLGVDSDPVTSLQKLSIPGLWIFGGNDGSIPVDLSIQRLEALRAEGRPYDYVLFSGIGHNNIPETFSTAISWLQRRLTSGG